MSPEQSPTLTQSALRGIACRCPRCGRGKLYGGFLDLRPNCESCGLDYAFIDSGDGPAIFIIMLAGAVVVAAALAVARTGVERANAGGDDPGEPDSDRQGSQPLGEPHALCSIANR